jgi:hypothetical protein
MEVQVGAAALSLISCCCLTRITPAPRPPTRTKSPRMVAITFLPPLLGFPAGVTTGGISKLGAAEPDVVSVGTAPSTGDGSGGKGGVSVLGISAGGSGICVGSLGGFTWAGVELGSMGLFWSGI